MNGGTEMLSNARNAGFRFLRGEGVGSLDGSPPCGCGWGVVVRGLGLHEAPSVERVIHTVGGAV